MSTGAVDARVCQKLRHRDAMRASARSSTLAGRVSLPALRWHGALRIARWYAQGLSVQRLPSSGVADCRHAIAGHQTAADPVVPGDLLDQQSQNRAVGADRKSVV